MDEQRERFYLTVMAIEDPLPPPPPDPALERRLLAVARGELQRTRARRARRWAAVSVMALAACLALVLWRPGRGGPLPQYQLEVASDQVNLGPTPAGAVRLAATSWLSVTLRPHREHGRDVQVRAFVQRDGALRQWMMPRPQQLPSGLLRVRAPVREVLSLRSGEDAGRWELIMAVGSGPGEPDAQAVAQALRAGGATGAALRVGGWQLLRQEIAQ